MNAGAYGSELKDVIVSATVCDRDGKLIESYQKRVWNWVIEKYYSRKKLYCTSGGN